MTVFALVLFSYFIVTSGVAYDIINEPPAVGAQPDPVTGKVKPVTFLPYRINAQYIIEGLSGGFMYTLGAVGLVLLDVAHGKQRPANTRLMALAVGSTCLTLAWMSIFSFLRIKMPGYLHW